MAQALDAHPALSVMWGAAVILSVVTLIGMVWLLQRRRLLGVAILSSVPPLKIPVSDVLTLVLVLCWMMVFPAVSWLFFAVTIGGVIWLLRRYKVDLERQWGIGRFPLWKLIPLAMVIYLAAMGLVAPVSYWVDFLASRYHWDAAPQVTVDAFLKTGRVPELCWLLFAAVALAPATEEILFRGFLHPVLKNQMPAKWAWIVTALIFSLIHFHTLTFPQLFLFGLVLGATYEITGSLPLCVGVHMCFNAATAIWLLALKWWL